MDADEKLLVRDGKPVSLPPKALDLLFALVERRGHIVEKVDLIERVWPDTFVEEGNLTYTVRLLRKALGDDAENPRFIETIPRRGYRFVAAVENASPDAAADNARAQGIFDDFAVGDFVGRSKEISEITELLGREETRLLTLTGTGGTGKTTLSKEIGRRVREHFSEGVYFVELAAVTDPSIVTTVVAHALNVSGPGHRNVTEILADRFRGKAALLILDNFEQIVAAAPEIGQLLKGSCPLKILVTSREPLKITLETEYKVPPLAFPAGLDDQSGLTLMRYEAVEFFINKARRSNPDLQTFENDLRTIAAICHRLDGLPLALELAAARARVLSAPEILAKLEHSLTLLTGGARDLPGRHQTMRATIAWSYDLLNDDEKAVFARLAVFEGGFTFEAAERVLGNDASDGQPTAILDAITSLIEKGLLIADGHSHKQRFRMLVVVREFALELLKESGGFTTTASSHADHFLKLAEDAEPKLETPEVSDWVKRLEIEHDNLRAAIKSSMTADPPTAARIAKAIRLFWMLRGYTREAQFWYREILKAQDVRGQYRWNLLTGLANMTQFLGDFATAKEVYLQSLDESRALENQKYIAQSLRGVAGAVYMLGDTVAAKMITDEALSISRGIEDDFGTAAALARFGDIALKEGNAAEARSRAEEALEIFRRIGFMPGIASKLMNLGMAEVADGALESARDHLNESLRIAIETGDYITTRLALEAFSFVHSEAGEHFDAARLLAAAFRMGDEIDHSLEPSEMRLRDLFVEKSKLAMGEPAFADAYSQGLQLSRAEAIELALGTLGVRTSKLRLVQKELPRRRASINQ